MKDIPVLFSPPMVQALFREVEKPGTGKTNTRRHAWRAKDVQVPGSLEGTTDRQISPTSWQKVQAGDRLWVRELHWRWGQWDYQPDRADHVWKFFAEKHDSISFEENAPGITWQSRVAGKLAWWRRPAIFHPRELSRLTLVVEATKIERLQEMREADCIAEGADIIQLLGNPVDDGPMVRLKEHVYGTPRTWFRELWDTLHGAGSWDSNPEVVCISFRPIATNIDSVREAASPMTLRPAAFATLGRR